MTTVPANQVHPRSSSPEPERPRVVLLMNPATYRAGAFMEAGERIGLDLVRALDLPDALATQWH
ncbi:MAG: hypothetical protein M3440_02730, partial [Chloroflexota bacterium]|nr:hypothetical protein [Chloroflexota bacterium]